MPSKLFPSLLRIVPLWFGTICFFSVNAYGVDHSAWDRLLKEGVDKGVVNYGFMKEKFTELQDYLKTLESVDLERLSREEKMALYINAYNAHCIRGVLDQGEIGSVRDVFQFFKNTEFVLGGKHLSLDSLEHEELRPMGDPRIHFAIVCSSKSCPSLRSGAYFAETLEEVLNDQTRSFLNDPEKNRLDPEIKVFYLSKIFQWFTQDFTQQHRSVMRFAMGYLDPDSKKFLEENEGKVRVEFLPYDWSLNGHY